MMKVTGIRYPNTGEVLPDVAGCPAAAVAVHESAAAGPQGAAGSPSGWPPPFRRSLNAVTGRVPPSSGRRCRLGYECAGGQTLVWRWTRIWTRQVAFAVCGPASP